MDYGQVTGAFLSPVDVRDYRIKPCNTAALPEEFELKMPEVKNQGSVSSCVAHSISTIIEYYSRLQGDENREFSVGYIYGNRRNYTTEPGKGMYVRLALDSVREYGDVIHNLFPYNTEVPEVIDSFEREAPKLFTKGYPYRISSYFACKSKEEIKTALSKNIPILVVVDWKPGTFIAEGRVIMSGTSTKHSYHALVIYGWDKYGWKIQNSWGTGWANHGRAILPYDVELVEAYGIVDTISENLRNQEINHLLDLNKELQEKINSLLVDKEQLLQSLRDMCNTDKTDKVEIEKFEKEIADLQNNITNLKETQAKAIAALSAQIEEQQKEIERLKSENIELRKPYNSAFGRAVAKVLNFFANLFRKK